MGSEWQRLLWRPSPEPWLLAAERSWEIKRFEASSSSTGKSVANSRYLPPTRPRSLTLCLALVRVEQRAAHLSGSMLVYMLCSTAWQMQHLLEAGCKAKEGEDPGWRNKLAEESSTNPAAWAVVRGHITQIWATSRKETSPVAWERVQDLRGARREQRKLISMGEAHKTHPLSQPAPVQEGLGWRLSVPIPSL